MHAMVCIQRKKGDTLLSIAFCIYFFTRTYGRFIWGAFKVLYSPLKKMLQNCEFCFFFHVFLMQPIHIFRKRKPIRKGGKLIYLCSFSVTNVNKHIFSAFFVPSSPSALRMHKKSFLSFHSFKKYHQLCSRIFKLRVREKKYAKMGAAR